ncbi:MAG: ubiquinone/menaquinone biosynthesis methyltransferase [Anaerolineaceae bacterium]|jgi:demethylmenaquinone methyltransferase/2-methoxy-6-polyprenyl-1,4-benzoquinol methylase
MTMNLSASKAERAQDVRRMFGKIAPRYDLMNRLMTGGQDVRLRREVIRRAALPQDGILLDLGAGTGDLAREASRQYPKARCVAADFTLEMMQVGQKHAGAALNWAASDALQIPFQHESFDALVSGYLLRNVVDLPLALREQWRVLKPGGTMISLDTTQPRKSILSPLIHFYTHVVIPFVGGLLSGNRSAYVYLPASTDRFLTAEELAEEIRAAGFEQVGFKLHLFGTMAIHWARKPKA